MNLAAVDSKDWIRWGQHPASALVDHGRPCCREAKNWFLSMARSFDFSITENQRRGGTRWLNARYKWGPNPWPLAWCEAIHRQEFDCGVFAAVAREIFKARGLESYGGQVILRVDPHATSHFQKQWSQNQQGFNWIGRGFVYHEIVIVESGREALLYDATEATWLKPESIDSFESPIAVRSEAHRALNWGTFTLYPDQWCELSEGTRK